MEQKHFMDIVHIREESDELKQANTGCFESGDIIQISEKWDGSNACAAYDIEADSMVAFSRKRCLSYDNTLNGFWNYVQTLNKEDYKDTPNYRIFGEWGAKNAIRYRDECYKHWYVYDIYDVEKEEWLPQTIVKQFCQTHNLEYIHVLYEGPFISWDHVKSFLGQSAYGDIQEGVVIKNQTKLNDPNTRQPFYLKIVGKEFKETKVYRHIAKVEDPQKTKARAKAQEIVEAIVTKRRVEKELFKMRDEQILPDKIQPQDMKVVAQNLPKRIYEDCLKEEKELVIEAGEYFGKICGTQAMKFAKEIILGE